MNFVIALACLPLLPKLAFMTLAPSPVLYFDISADLCTYVAIGGRRTELERGFYSILRAAHERERHSRRVVDGQVFQFLLKQDFPLEHTKGGWTELW